MRYQIAVPPFFLKSACTYEVLPEKDFAGFLLNKKPLPKMQEIKTHQF